MYNVSTNILEMKKLETCHHCGEEKEDCYHGFISMTLPIPEAEALIDKWGRGTWWENLERTDLTEDQMKELDSLSYYDQLLNTVGRGIQCDDCALKEAEFGKKKYGTDLDRTDLDLEDYLQHALEEHMDAILYLTKALKLERERKEREKLG